MKLTPHNAETIPKQSNLLCESCRNHCKSNGSAPTDVETISENNKPALKQTAGTIMGEINLTPHDAETITQTTGLFEKNC